MNLNNKNNIDNIFNDKLLDDLHIFSNQLNKLFFNINQSIYNIIFKINKIKSRNNKLKFTDVVSYLFNYTFINSTKNDVVSNLNYDNNLNVHYSNYQKKESKIPLIFYHDLFNNIQSLFYTNYSDTKYLNNSIDNKKNIVCVDGTYNNTTISNDGNLESSLNMGYFDFNNKIPVNIKFKGVENKNKEIKSFIHDIENKNINTNDVVFVFDRAYFSYDLINYLDKNNYNYVIRVKKSSLYLKKDNNKINKIKKQINNKNVRFVNYEHKYIFEKINKNNIKIKLEKTTKCDLITNLNINDYDDIMIKNIYKNRWSIEVFFKILKLNFKFTNMNYHNVNSKTQYEKQYFIILIQYYIIRIIENIYLKNLNDLNKHKFNKNNKNKYVMKHNKSLMIKGLKKIINNIINANINKYLLYQYSNNFISKINIQIDVYKERKCKNPGYKWYIKSYAEYYKYNKIIDAILKNKIDDLDKNLKLLASELKII